MGFPAEIRRIVLERNQLVGEKKEKCVFQGGRLSLLGRKRHFFYIDIQLVIKEKEENMFVEER